MKSIPAILMLAFLVTSCNFFRAPGKDKCDKIISIKKMIDILEEVYLLEAYLLEPKSSQIHNEDSVIYYYGGLFEKHGVTKWEFEMALNCYLLNEKDMLTIHEELLNRFSILQSLAEQSIALENAYDRDGDGKDYELTEYRMFPVHWHLGIPEKPEIKPDSLLFRIYD
jgi:hypothetical protein